MEKMKITGFELAESITELYYTWYE